MIDFDPAGPFPELRQLRQSVIARDWPAVATFFGGLTDPNDQAYAGAFVSEIDGSEEFLRAVAESERSQLARALYGNRLIVVGWNIRSALRAQHVSREQFAAFHEHLRQAERILIDVTAEEPGNPVAWVGRLKTCRGLQLGLPEARRRYDRLSRHTPYVYNAQASLVQQLCTKWGGSDEQARTFGLECLRRGPEGSLGALALLEAHLEIALETGLRQVGVYLQRPDVRAEIDEAAARSVRHPAFRADGYLAITAHNLFALVYSKMGEHAVAAEHFRAAAGHGSGLYWDYFGDDKATAFETEQARAWKVTGQ